MCNPIDLETMAFGIKYLAKQYLNRAMNKQGTKKYWVLFNLKQIVESL